MVEVSMPTTPASLRRTVVTVFLLLAALVFVVPATRSHVASAGLEPGDYGPNVPVNRTSELADAATTGELRDAYTAAPPGAILRDAYVSTPPGVALPEVTSKAYAIVERGCGAMVMGNNAYTRLPPASVTKVITALTVLQHVKADAMVDVDVDYEHPYFHDSSLMGLKPGMKLSVQDLLFGLMLPSGNDAAEALARYVGAGDVNAFVRMMNESAAGFGMRDTRFANPSGLDQDGLYSTAWDLAQVSRVALDNPLMMRISTTLSYKPNWDGPALKNGNSLLKSYPGAYGLKIGFTDAAKQTIVAAADRNGRQLVVSVLASDDRYGDTRALLDWAFANTRSAC
jgi:D-alanyl-D-alanine carboxypeptidase (penicillin-binding protein 5/6)